MADPEGQVSMPISETGRLTDRAAGRPDAPGFTLIELVAVMTIMSVLALALIVGSGSDTLFGRDRASDAARAARTFEQAVGIARSQAFHARLPHGLLPRQDGWQLLRRDRDTGGWRAADPPVPVQGLAWVIEGTVHFPAPALPDSPPLPRVIFASDGRSTAFSVDFHAGQDRFRCETDGWEALQCSRR